MKKGKIMALFLASSLFFFSSCGYDNIKPKPQPAPVQNSESDAEREKRNAERHRAMEEDYGYPLDTSIEVTNDEMDRFISVAKNYKLPEREVRRLVRIFKQVGMNFNPRLNIKVEEITEEKITWAMGAYEYETKGYIVECAYPGTEPQLIIDGISRNRAGYYVFNYGRTSDGLDDFEVYFKFLFDEAYYPIYKNHKIIATVKDLSCTVEDSALERMQNEIARVVSAKGKFVEIQKFYPRTLSRPFTAEECDEILSGNKAPTDFDVEELENVTFRGVEALKRSAELIYRNSAPCIIVFPDVIVESNVYGEGKKKFYGEFKFRESGALIEYKLWESKNKVE